MKCGVRDFIDPPLLRKWPGGDSRDVGWFGPAFHGDSRSRRLAEPGAMAPGRTMPIGCADKHLSMDSRTTVASIRLVTTSSSPSDPVAQGMAIKAVLDAMGLSGEAAVCALRHAVEQVHGDPRSPEQAFERVSFRSIGAEDEILAEEGGAVTVVEFARALDVSVSTIEEYRKSGRIFGVPHGLRGYLYPVWQIHERTVLPRLDQELKQMAGSPWSVLLYFLTPAEALDDERPLDLLRRGRTAAILEHVENAR